MDDTKDWFVPIPDWAYNTDLIATIQEHYAVSMIVKNIRKKPGYRRVKIGRQIVKEYQYQWVISLRELAKIFECSTKGAKKILHLLEFEMGEIGNTIKTDTSEGVTRIIACKPITKVWLKNKESDSNNEFGNATETLEKRQGNATETLEKQSIKGYKSKKVDKVLEREEQNFSKKREWPNQINDLLAAHQVTGQNEEMKVLISERWLPWLETKPNLNQRQMKFMLNEHLNNLLIQKKEIGLKELTEIIESQISNGNYSLPKNWNFNEKQKLDKRRRNLGDAKSGDQKRENPLSRTYRGNT